MGTWQDRRWAGRSHPLCVYSRLAAAYFLVLCVYTYRWLSYDAIWPIGMCLFFLLINPFIFPAPRHDRAWATRAVLGQRLWRGLRQWDVPTFSRIGSALCYFLALYFAFEGALREALLFVTIASGLRIIYLNWMAGYYDRQMAGMPAAKGI